MEGRWTIHSRGWGHVVTPTDPKDVAPGSWPVVPCDEAAVRRATTALLKDSGLPIYGGYRANIERRVRLSFAAAGETP